MKKLFLTLSLIFLVPSTFYLEESSYSEMGFTEYQLPKAADFLTKEEIEWLNLNPVIRVAPDPNFAPFEFIDTDGKYKGIGADYLSVVEKILGIRFEILAYTNWSDIIEDFKSKKIDLLNTVISNEVRSAYMIFPPPYLFIPTVIVARKGEIKGISLEQLGKYRIVMVKDYGLTEYFLEKYRGYKTILVRNNTRALELLVSKEADVFIADVATAEYYIRKGGFLNLEMIDIFKPDSIMGFGVRKDWPIFKNILEKTQKKIPYQIYNSILKRWIGVDYSGRKLIKNFILISLITLFSLITLIILLLSISYRLNLVVNDRTERLKEELERVKILEKEIRENKNFLENILNEMPLPFIITDEKGKIIMLNHSFRNCFSFQKDEIFLMQDILKAGIFSKEDEFLKKLQTVFSGNETDNISFESIELNCNDDKKHTFNIKYRRLEKNFIFIFLDLTEILTLQKKLKESLKEKDLLIKEIHHRVKNNFNIVISLLNLQKSRSQIDNVKESLSVAQNRIFSMALIHEMLYQSNQFTEVVISQYINRLLKYLKGIYSEIFERVSFDLKISEDISLSMDTAIPFGMIVNEILMNSFKHAFPDNRKGIIKIHIYKEKKQLMLKIGDNGVGIKNIEDISEGKTLGFTLIESLSHQLKGEINYENKNGLFYKISIPLEK
ncbi:MAG: histidine kinase dimerization/phosphoacceptor domain -containing protein [Brevinematia bacterium]